MAVRIRMKMMGRKHRPFFRICAVDSRNPRDGRVLEELGTYDPMVPDTDARALLKGERINYWLGVGAQPSDKVSVLIKKYGASGTHVDAADARPASGWRCPRSCPMPGEPVYVPGRSRKPPKPAEAAGSRRAERRGGASEPAASGASKSVAECGTRALRDEN